MCVIQSAEGLDRTKRQREEEFSSSFWIKTFIFTCFWIPDSQTLHQDFLNFPLQAIALGWDSYHWLSFFPSPSDLNQITSTHFLVSSLQKACCGTFFFLTSIIILASSHNKPCLSKYELFVSVPSGEPWPRQLQSSHLLGGEGTKKRMHSDSCLQSQHLDSKGRRFSASLRQT